ADAAVPGQHQIEERQHHDAVLARVCHEESQHPELNQLIERRDHGCEGEATAHFYVLLFESASTVSAQRRQRSGWDLTEPTSGSTFQQRAHFSPAARPTATLTPGTSGRVKAPCGARSCANAASEVMKISGRSTRPKSASLWDAA